ncbi:DNA-binding transcriptional regulator YhcF (GntR family) [Arthrobacter stackebrandtii]|uniref:DNA-binding transcriptional regulator YhcF (GntR family) n=1 Tax=Arthrobacter stackebrandtii TaxID=272161 RepID=A0ABS4Z0G1_9MICC|nr:GntR family transcriptional regulator [Arthrobacter stackebrandtii]MBP2414551.1 DNA-binding transcriptional regulator YhcF (GntR family) [Arthrobacter stackebrandtii]PYH01662.1 GntR family transcriptional regulator [Arthrobacter stackebrandtii]
MNAMDILMRRWRLETESTVPPFEQVRLRILDLAASGELAVGTKLPSVRALAADLGVAANTVARAYRELEQAGVVVTAGRSGTSVATGGDRLAAKVADAADAFAAVVRELGVPQAQALRIVTAALERG